MLWTRERSSHCQPKGKKNGLIVLLPAVWSRGSGPAVAEARWWLRSWVIAHGSGRWVGDGLALSPPFFPRSSTLARGWKPTLRFFPLGWERAVHYGHSRFIIWSFRVSSRCPGPAAAEARRRFRSRGSHMDLADRLETGSPYLHLHSSDLALSLWVQKPALRSFPPLFWVRARCCNACIETFLGL